MAGPRPQGRISRVAGQGRVTPEYTAPTGEVQVIR